ncbi:LysR family transcriptional regulator [Brevundimonas aurifodinae]|uniref:LysR family transcriptional regulator n=2 Tax=Brevundimonas TaxID=41275 RepID=A0ABV1NLB4_9CAUL|nr:MAG: hypothetical protein B7Z01_15025 [Brevundimonas subvibrioides]
MNDTTVRRLDPALLMIFQETYRTGKLSLAGERLGLTPSAVSHALVRLRDIFQDDLFRRLPHGVQPTVRAHALAPAVALALEALRDLVQPQARFEPSTTDRCFRLSMLDAGASLLLPDLLAGASSAAPSATLTTRAVTRDATLAALSRGDLDLAVGYFWNPPAGIQVEPLMQEDYAVVWNGSTPPPDSLDAYVAARHLLVSSDGEPSGIVDVTLRKLGRRRKVAATAPNFFVALAAVAEADLVVTVPRRFALRWADRFDLSVTEPPLSIRSFTMAMAWSVDAKADEGLAWLRGLMAEIVAANENRPAGFPTGL